MDIKELAKLANELHSEIETHLRTSLLKAKRCGEVLIEAKSKVEHGEWMNWIAENFDASHQTACAYMRIAKYWCRLEPVFEKPDVFEAVETIDHALKLIARYKPSRLTSQANPVCNEPTSLQKIKHSFSHFVVALTERLHDLLDYDTLYDWHHQRQVLDAKRYDLPDGRTAIVLTTKLITEDLDGDAWAVDEEELLSSIEPQ
ncbi:MULTISPECIES: DUF3102 domain-containing protein [Rhodopirellula]|uniref:DUF3102 domain-containing protein n=1 Tax=Rhodopirellula TaxID=265488 RepID=UPI00257FF71A|nr:DUF3102 domain-containing protein [Rhodopirellula sp. UBA1907]|tara:strand:- start:313 stop:918 length:606 start_codon:yes stop_codon:yes gene_type:complete